VAVWSLTLVLVGLAAAILGAGMAGAAAPLPGLGLAAPLVATLYLLAEWFPVHLRVRRETHTFSLTEIPLVVGLYFLPPLAVVLAQTLGAGTALVAHRRQAPMRLAFNLANFAFSTTCAAAVFHVAPESPDVLGPVGMLAAYLAAMAADQLSGLGVAVAIWLSGGDRPEFREHVGLGWVYTFVDASLALVGVMVLSSHPAGFWLLTVPVITTLFGFRLYQDERIKRESLASLQQATSVLQEVADASSVTQLLLQQVRDMFSVRVAALVISPGTPLPAGVWTLDIDGRVTADPGGSPVPEADLVDLIRSHAGGITARREDGGTWLPVLDRLGLDEAIIAPLHAGELIGGALIAGDRLVNAGPFRPDHVSLLSTLANHAGVAMKNTELVDRLRAEAQVTAYQARHDALTDLPNRIMFQEQVDAALRDEDAACAVLLLDIDRFKEVNDTLGHHNGDLLLEEFAARLVACAPGPGLVARLSGDEYAILVTGRRRDPVSMEERSVEVARRVATTLQVPFQLEGLALVVTASIGISLSPEHGSTAAVLLRRADVAMYNVKRDHATGFEFYRPDRDEYSAARLALVADLRAALKRDQIEVAYQLQVNAATGRVEGAEALARWRHPSRGVIMPGEFIELAEHAGLIRGLTERVLRIAVRDAMIWRDRWPDLRVAVNLSPRLLLDPSVAPLIHRVLVEHGLPPSGLTIEVTESAIVGNAGRVEEALRDLTSLGCDLSIDDFGTGYSSFSYIGRLAIHELKVDRSFVAGMANSEADMAIVELTVGLAHRLGKRVVAEGVETDFQAARLANLGCDVLQGYLISRPISHEALLEAVAARHAATSESELAGPGWGSPEPGVRPLATVRRLGEAS
jgi:diguanylate cyclase (GGDEF)-like protein